MKPTQNRESIHPSEKISWLEIALYLKDLNLLNLQNLQEWAGRVNRVTVTGPGERPSGLPGQIKWEKLDPERSLVEIRNCRLREAESDWILFLEDDEEVDTSQFAGLRNHLREDQWVPALINCQPETDTLRNYIQIRMVPKSADPVYEGFQIPDATRTLLEKEVQLSTRVVGIDRKSCPVEQIVNADLFSEPVETPQSCLIQGEKKFRERKYAQASALYRRVLKVEKLLPFDRVAAVNGLASCMTEQYRWQQALTLAAQSIEAEPHQRLPYLIIYRISQLNKNWEKSYQILSDYHQILSRDTRANFDRALSETETLVQLGAIAKRTDRLESALDCYEHLVAIHPDDEENGWIEEALRLSVKTGHFEKSVFYFRNLFEHDLPDQLSPERSEELYDIMSSFMEQGWYNYVSKVYEQLYQADADNGEYRRRLIVALSKSNRLEKAKALIA
ncbi:MAG: tetratricopeptide repeat protein [Balneolaceae bacterium]